MYAGFHHMLISKEMSWQILQQNQLPCDQNNQFQLIIQFTGGEVDWYTMLVNFDKTMLVDWRWTQRWEMCRDKLKEIIIIIIYHDFLPTSRRGSHVKSGKTHTQSSRYNP